MLLRRMFRISHLDRNTNVDFLEMAKAKQTLLRTIHERKLKKNHLNVILMKCHLNFK